MAEQKKLVLGVCAMDTKARSKPMRNILDRLLSTGYFEAVIFGDKVILDEAIENWPSCDFFISFFSTGFPLQKAVDYVNLRRPFCVNDLPMQQLLWDRRLVLRVLDSVGVPTPRRLMTHQGDEPDMTPDIQARLRRLGAELPGKLPLAHAEMVDDDTIRVGTETMKKPFVEKPVSGEDHNVHIYYPKSAGGGVRRLFRKVGNKSSEFFPEDSVIRTDASYIYEEFMQVDNAEDVKVYTIGDKYAHAETRKSPVVDGVVKRNPEGKEVRYVTQLTDEEKEMARRVSRAFGQTICGFDLLRANGRSYVIDVNGWSFVKGNPQYYDKCAEIMRDIFLETARKAPGTLTKEPSIENQWKLKAFLSVLRHGDRTPKQKVKFIFTTQPFMSLLNGKKEEIVFKGEDQLALVSTACRTALSEKIEDQTSLEQLRMILDAKSSLLGTKAQTKPIFNKKDKTLEKVQVIVKWGGEFTHGGLHQSKDLGENLRKDLLIVSKELLEDVKVYTSSERRVLATADIFCRAFLGVDSLPENYAVVSKEMLDDSNAAKEPMENIKNRLQAIINPKSPAEVPEGLRGSLKDGVEPSECLRELIELMGTLREVMRDNFRGRDVEGLQNRWCCQETPGLFKERWEKLFKDFCDVEPEKFDPSKVSELYDSLKYDLLHNRKFLDAIFTDPTHTRSLLKRLYINSKRLFDFVAPNEYGLDSEEKLQISVETSLVLLNTLVQDLQSARSNRGPSTRLYFTKESKVIALLNTVLLCGLPTKVQVGGVPELDYLTQITFELHERNGGLMNEDPEAREYSLRIGFSPGAHDPNLIDTHLDSRHSLSVAPRRWITDHCDLSDALKFLAPKIEVGEEEGEK
ncbi:hypothetical protein HDV00_004941 [Rhizophlyctis rosea]|nr:hypothetical protein HDV00_004941 [Rhizophlyctis rosea]